MHDLTTTQRLNNDANHGTTQTLVVTIGRNVTITRTGEQEAMPLHAWTDFRDQVLVAVEKGASRVLYSATGTGQWDDINEDTFIVGAQINSGKAFEVLRDLKAIAYKFAQEAFGFVLADATASLVFTES